MIREWSSYTYDDMLAFHPEDKSKIGYLIGDEPTIPKIDEYVPVYNRFRENDPGRLCLVNLFPSGVSESRLSGSFLEYVDAYFDRLNPRYCSLDNYPCFWFDQENANYYHDIELIRHHSKKNGTKQIGFVQVHSSALHRDVSESDVLWQVNSLLAYGCKGLWYFNFRNPGAPNACWPHETPIAAVPEAFEAGVLDTRQGQGVWSGYHKPAYQYGGAALDFYDKPTQAYYHVQKANAQALAWGPLLLELKHVAVRHTLGFKESAPPVGTDGFAVEPYIQSVAAVQGHQSKGFVVSWFKDQQQRSYVMIVNKRHGEYMSGKGGALDVNIALKENVQVAYIVSCEDGSEKQVELKAHSNLKMLSLPVEGGNAILMRIEAD